MINKLTKSEWEGLVSSYNLADGHAHQEQDKYQSVVNRLPSIFMEAESVPQDKLQDEFEQVFFKLAGQNSYKQCGQPIYNYACSISIEVVANYLKNNNISISLIHPTFDNIADILKRNEVSLECLDEDWLTTDASERANIDSDAIFIVCPNNPTGQNISRTQYESLVDYCALNNKLLIVDCSFRFYSDLHTWDQYKKLTESNIDFIVFEDTGKTWPTLDLKLGITIASQNVYPELLEINNDFLLNVSPFVFKILIEYMKVDVANQNQVLANSVVAQNRSVLAKLTENTQLETLSANSELSVDWIKLPEGWKSSSFTIWLTAKDFHVLRGAPFFWHAPEKGEQYIRIALARPFDTFEKSAKRFVELVKKYESKMEVVDNSRAIGKE